MSCFWPRIPSRVTQSVVVSLCSLSIQNSFSALLVFRGLGICGEAQDRAASALGVEVGLEGPSEARMLWARWRQKKRGTGLDHSSPYLSFRAFVFTKVPLLTSRLNLALSSS